MKKFSLIFVSLLALIFCFSDPAKAALQEEILKSLEIYPELQEYRQIFFENLRNQDLDWPEKCQKIIGEYLVFIVKHPWSEFVDEAKLRIAEFHELSYQKKKALPYLNDIIKNYSQADYFSLSSKYDRGVKTAAWALYYRGLWFPGPQSVVDWKKILEKYPESKEAVRLAKAALLKSNIQKKSGMQKK